MVCLFFFPKRMLLLEWMPCNLLLATIHFIHPAIHSSGNRNHPYSNVIPCVNITQIEKPLEFCTKFVRRCIFPFLSIENPSSPRGKNYKWNFSVIFLRGVISINDQFSDFRRFFFCADVIIYINILLSNKY